MSNLLHKAHVFGNILDNIALGNIWDNIPLEISHHHLFCFGPQQPTPNLTAQCYFQPKPCVQVYSHPGQDYSVPPGLARFTKYNCEAKLRREFISQNRLMSPCKHKGPPTVVGEIINSRNFRIPNSFGMYIFPNSQFQPSWPKSFLNFSSFARSSSLTERKYECENRLIRHEKS